jgi:uncharacterized membrane protein YbhN (UPF0104 family)
VSKPPPPPRNRLRALAALVLQVGCLAYVGRVLWQQRNELSRALDFDVKALLALALLMAVAHLQRAYEFTYMLHRLGAKEPFWEGFLLTGAGFLLNHLPFNAGLVMRASVLKRDHALPYTSYVAMTAVNALVNIAVAAVVGLAAVFVATPGGVSMPLVAAFALIFVGASGALLAPRSWMPRGTNFIARRLAVAADGLALIRGNGSGLLLLGVLACTKVLMAGVRMWICFDALGARVSPIAAGVLASTTILMSVVSVTPGNLGLRELALAASSTLLGSSYAVGVAAASLDRVVLLAYTLVSGLPGLWALRRRGPFAAVGNR